MLNRKHLQKENVAASRIQAIVRGFLVRKKLPKIKEELHNQKLVRAATLIQVNCQYYSYNHTTEYRLSVRSNYLTGHMERLYCKKEISM